MVACRPCRADVLPLGRERGCGCEGNPLPDAPGRGRVQPVLSIRLLLDPPEIDRILSDPWIFGKIKHDDRAPGFIDHPAVSYFGAYVDGELQGVFTAIRTTSCDADVHAAIFRPAVIHSRALGRLFIAEMFTDPKLLRLTAHVIGNLISAINYCRKLGFEPEGVRYDAVVQKSRALPIVSLGLRRSSWAESA